jgi:hypothetical protein
MALKPRRYELICYTHLQNAIRKRYTRRVFKPNSILLLADSFRYRIVNGADNGFSRAAVIPDSILHFYIPNSTLNQKRLRISTQPI